MELFLSIMSTVLIVLVILFLLSLLVYFFNIDMKLASKMQPLLNKWYDHHKRRPLP